MEEHLIPNLKDRIEVEELATPKTIEKWGGTTGGSTSGFSWDQKKSFLRTNSFTKTFIKTGVKNLYQTGAFSTQNGGVAMSAITGKLTAEYVIKDSK
jgi:phytoene dehydrogenase-like protein